MEEDYSIVLFVSTGRCGTTFLANSIHADNAFVCHEYEVPDAQTVLRDLYIPAARSGSRDQALQAADYYKIPQMRHTLLQNGKSMYIDTGHQYNYAMFPALLSRLSKVRLVRLRRDRYDTALSFMTKDPAFDIWNVESYNGYYRWMMNPHHKISENQSQVLGVWTQLTRLQKTIWAIDEVERLWQKLLVEFEFPYIEYDFTDLEAGNFTKLEQFLQVQVTPTDSARARNSSRFWKRKKPAVTRAQFDLEDQALKKLYSHQICDRV